MSDERSEPRQEEQDAAPQSKELQLARVKNEYAKLITWRWITVSGCLAALLLAATPLAEVVAGTDTTFNFSMNIATSATLGLTTVTGYGYGVLQGRRAKHLDERNKALERRIEELLGALRDLAGREA